MLNLADPDEPLQLPDGTIISANGVVKRTARPAPGVVEVPTHNDAKNIVMNTRRALSDLPLPPKATNPVAIVLCYVLFGLGNTDIAIATGLSEQQVTDIRMSDPFAAMYESVRTSVIEKESENVRGFFTAASRSAAMKMTALMAESESDVVAQKAAADILDRAGHRPADVVELRGKMDNTLRIVHIKKDDKVIPENVIDLEVSSDDRGP